MKRRQVLGLLGIVGTTGCLRLTTADDSAADPEPTTDRPTATTTEPTTESSTGTEDSDPTYPDGLSANGVTGSSTRRTHRH